MTDKLDTAAIRTMADALEATIGRLLPGARSMEAEAMRALCDALDELRAENERLRAALQRIEAASQFWAEYPEGNAAIRYAHESTRRLASAALVAMETNNDH